MYDHNLKSIRRLEIQQTRLHLRQRNGRKISPVDCWMRRRDEYDRESQNKGAPKDCCA